MTPPVTTEALAFRNDLVAAICKGGFGKHYEAADAFMASHVAPLLAAHQQVTAERDEDRAELARLRAEGEAKDRALKLLLPFVDYAAGEGLMFVETEDGEHPEMDAADIMSFAAQALGLEIGSDAYLSLLPEGYAAIRDAYAKEASDA